MATAIQRVTSTRPSLSPLMPAATVARTVQIQFTLTGQPPETVGIVMGECASPPPVNGNDLTNRIFFAVGAMDQLVSDRQSTTFTLVGKQVDMVGATGWAAGNDIYFGIYILEDGEDSELLAVFGPVPVG